MNRQNVNSSNLASVGYDETSNTLEVEFNNGGIYQYFNVPESVYKVFVKCSILFHKI
jgi:hypothetical protein